MRGIGALGALLGLLLLAPSAYAAFDDVTLTSSAVLSVNGIQINITGSSAVVETITVNSTNFSFTLLQGSSIQMSVPGLTELSASPTTGRTSVTCSATESNMAFGGEIVNPPVTITITPTGNACSQANGGGGGGWIYVPPAVTGAVAPTTTTATTVTAPPSTIASSSSTTNLAPPTGGTPSYIFTRNLSLWTTGEEVRTLQRYLNAQGFTLATNGPGSPGNETTTFGMATYRAVLKLQGARGVTQSGYFGPRTRAAVNASP